MAVELKNIDIRFISLVKAGANNRHIVWKSAEGDVPELVTVPIVKTVDEKRMVYGIVYAPDDIDTQGEYAVASEIEDSAHRFMRGLHLHNVDKQHSYNPEEAYVAESWIVRKGDPIFPKEKEGSWAVGIKVEGEDLWGDVKKGEVKALSMAGTANKIRKDDERRDAGSFEKFMNFLAAHFGKGEEKDMDKEEVTQIVKQELKPLQESIEKAKPHSNEDLGKIIKAALDEVMKPVTARIETLEKASPGSKQDDDPVKKNADLVKIGQDIAKMING